MTDRVGWFPGQLLLLPYPFAPAGLMPCEGQLLATVRYRPLHRRIGTTFGGDGKRFALPDYRGAAPPGSAYYVDVASAAPPASMPRYLGQVVLLPFRFVPRGYQPCEGRLLPVAPNAALFSLLGTRFGGDGAAGFALPDYSGRAPEGAHYFIATEGVVPRPEEVR